MHRPKPIRPPDIKHASEGTICWVQNPNVGTNTPDNDQVLGWRWMWNGTDWEHIKTVVSKNYEVHIESVPRLVRK